MTNRNNKKPYSKGKGKVNKEKDNYQDEAMKREFQKGEHAKRDFKDFNCRDKKFPIEKIKQLMNDASWYYKDAQILADVASYSFNKPLGTSLDTYETLNNTDRGVIGTFSAVPGVCTLTIAPVPGISTDAQSPVNLAATNVYSFVRYKNSGGSNYDSPDLMLYLLAMDSIYSCWNWLKRIYGLASTYSQTNRYLPKSLLYLNRVDVDDLLANLADFRAYLSVKAAEISAFCVPATMTYNVRHSWLFANVYQDSETRKAQTYMYVPAWFYKYDETSSPKGGLLTPVPVCQDWTFTGTTTSNLFKVSDLKNILNDMLEAVNYSEDIGIMSGDILKAFGESGLFKLSTVDPDYRVEPVYNRNVLTQIENSHKVEMSPNEYKKFTIGQNPDTNFIAFNPTFTLAGNSTYLRGWLNFHWDNPTPEDVIVASRLLATFSYNGTKQNGYIISCGSELVTAWDIYGYAVNNTGEDLTKPASTSQLTLMRFATDTIVEGVTDSPDLLLNRARLAAICATIAFDWAPALVVSSLYNGRSHVAGTTWDWDNYTSVTSENVEAMNQLALLSEFNVPN